MNGQSGFQFENNKDKIAIPFQLINNLVFIPLDVNGVSLNFLLDSGVDETILLSLDDKEEINLHSVKKIKLKGLGSNEPIEGLKSSNNILSYKGLIDRNHDVYIVLDQSFNFSSHIGIPVNGIIGYNFFKDNVVEVNYDKKKVFVYKDTKKMRRKKLKYIASSITLERNKPYLMSTVDLGNEEIPSKLLIDIGNSDALWLFENKEKNINVPKVKFEDYLGKGFSGDIHGFRAKIKSVTINCFQFANPIVAFPDSVSIKSVNRVADRAGSIGGELLKRFNIIFDYPNQTLYLKKSSYYDDPFSYNMSGIELQNDGMQWVQETVNLQTVNLDNTYDGNGNKAQNDFKLKFTLKSIFSVASVRKNSPAEASGLQVGDLILSINNVEAYRHTLQSINNLLKSEEGKWLYFEVERNGKKLKFKFQLKSIL
jgi:hypothetical protein